MKKSLYLSVVALTLLVPMVATGADNDWQNRVASALGKPGQDVKGVYRVSLPRTDVVTGSSSPRVAALSELPRAGRTVSR